MEEKVMLEPYDAYQLGRYLRQFGTVETIEDVYAKYAHPILLSEGYPVFTLNTHGSDAHCVFLQDGRCSVYEARLRVCRVYPFTIKNGSRGRRFEFYQCLDSHADHFQGGSVSVNEWMYENFTKAERTLFDKETEALPELGRLMRQLTQKQQEQFLFRLLYYRYYNFDLDQPFLEQYDRNQEALFRELKDWAARKG
ncbi:MAG: YkgJ family cysteine cluster protein [Bacteroidaceae bacterium]|nr:YkgJ family cysteine cluster protein [Bacteroidaceae bacterium]